MTREIVFISNGPALHRNQKGYAAQYFLRHFDKVHFLYWSQQEFREEEHQGDKVILHPYIAKRGGWLVPVSYIFWSFRELMRLKRENPDAKLVFCAISVAWAGIPALIAGKLLKNLVILRMDSDMIGYMKKENEILGRDSFKDKAKVFILKILHKAFLPFYDAVIGISEGISKKAKKLGAKKVFTIHIPVDTELFYPKESSEGGVKLLYAGQIKAMKGLHTLIKALQQIKKERGSAPKLQIIGAPSRPIDEKYFKKIKKQSEGLEVEFAGHLYVNEMPSIYRENDILVHPSYSEAQGMTIMEAMASGLPVIAFEADGPGDLVKNGETGFLVEQDDIEGFKEKIILLLEDEDMRKKMGASGRERVTRLVEETDKKYTDLWNISLK